ncbi:hypothetical protein [Mesobacillus zeae]|uniref:hypothetical protein n=1 Tax=Mesobacillus zeae TaxID=1917180 RepID=UPI00300A82BC
MTKDIMKIFAKYPNGEMFVVEWEDGFKFEGKIDTLHETDNGLDEDEPGYKEYHAAIFKIKKIIAHSQESRKWNIEEQQLYEVSMEEPPLSLYHVATREIVWKY